MMFPAQSSVRRVSFVFVSVLLLVRCSPGVVEYGDGGIDVEHDGQRDGSIDADQNAPDGGEGDTPTQLRVSITASDGGQVTPSGTVQVSSGDSLELAVRADEGFEVEGVHGCGGTLEGERFVTGEIVADCAVRALFAPVGPLTVTAAVSGDGLLDPSGAQPVQFGESMTFAMIPRIAGCSIEVHGTCATTTDLTTNQILVEGVTEDCGFVVDIDCGPSHIELRPENVGVFWTNRTEQFTATQVFAAGGERIDVTSLFEWSSSDEDVVSVNGAGLATAVIDHGIEEITVRDPRATTPLESTTTITVMRVTEWRHDSYHCDTYETTVFLDNIRVSRPHGIETVQWDCERSWPRGTIVSEVITGLIWFFYSRDGGLTYIADPWDYLADHTTLKQLERGAPASWLGIAITGLCKPRECNVRERSNIVFVEYPYPPNLDL